jgi:sugar lactone lactonase YvrE
MVHFGHGLSCLDETGWHVYNADNSPLRGNLHQVRTCPAGYFLILHTFGLTLFDGRARWRDVPADNLPGFPDRAACDGQNHLWLAHWNGVSVHDGASWKTLPLEQVSAGRNLGNVSDLAVSPQGEVWVLLDHGISRQQGQDWVVYAEGAGLAEEYYFARLALDSQRQPWVLHSGGLLHYAAGTDTWQEVLLGSPISPEALALGPQGQVWLAGFSGLLYLEPQGMTTDYSFALDDGEIGE